MKKRDVENILNKKVNVVFLVGFLLIGITIILVIFSIPSSMKSNQFRDYDGSLATMGPYDPPPEEPPEEPPLPDGPYDPTPDEPPEDPDLTPGLYPCGGGFNETCDGSILKQTWYELWCDEDGNLVDVVITDSWTEDCKQYESGCEVWDCVQGHAHPMDAGCERIDSYPDGTSCDLGYANIIGDSVGKCYGGACLECQYDGDCSPPDIICVENVCEYVGTEYPEGCTTDEECDDMDPLTSDSCVDGTCYNYPI